MILRGKSGQDGQIADTIENKLGIGNTDFFPERTILRKLGIVIIPVMKIHHADLEKETVMKTTNVYMGSFVTREIVEHILMMMTNAVDITGKSMMMMINIVKNDRHSLLRKKGKLSDIPDNVSKVIQNIMFTPSAQSATYLRYELELIYLSMSIIII